MAIRKDMGRGMIVAIFALVALSLFTAAPYMEAGAKKVSTKMKEPKESKTQKERNDTAGMQMTKGTFMVASECEDCNNGYKLSQLKFFGFDKPLTSVKESFFITNNTDRRLRGITLYITYNSTGGKMLHKRFLKLDCDIPAGETRKADIESFDTQRSFYYVKSAVPKKQATPFDVKFDLVAYYLEF